MDWRALVASGASATSALALDSTRVSGNDESMSGQGLTALLYADWTGPRGAYFDAMLSATHGRYSEGRVSDGFGASGSFTGQTYAARITGGRTFVLPKSVHVTPFAGLTMSHAAMHGYAESDDGAGVGLDVPGSSMNSLRSKVGVKIDRTIDTSAGSLTPYISFSEIHEFAGQSGTETTTLADSANYTYTIVSPTVARNLADLGVGAVLVHGKGVTLSARLDVQKGAHENDETASLKAEKKW